MDMGAELEFRSSVEDYNVRRSAELKSADRLSFYDLVTYIDNRDAAGDLDHSYLDYSDFANPRIVGVDDEDMSC